jgi:hypothetical protein
MPIRPDQKTIDEMKSTNQLFRDYCEELLCDFSELMSRIYGDSGGPTQGSVNIGFIGFCLGNLNACDEGSHFFQAMAEGEGLIEAISTKH